LLTHHFFEIAMHRFSILPALVLVAAYGCAPQTQEPTADGTPYVLAASQVEAGRYLIVVAGCNDCHTDGYLQSEGQIPEADWLAGSGLGWRGPWGTTYPSNLRLTAQTLTEEQWVQTLHTRKALPPMPWMNVNQMSAQDASAIYQYIRSLGATGEPAPMAVPLDQEPLTPYLLLEPQNLPPPPSN
jgi:mono/diheme cytochrome c family protein